MDPDTPPSNPPPPTPKRLSRPKITLQIPDENSPSINMPKQLSGQVYWGQPPRYSMRNPTTPMSQLSDPHTNPYFSPFAHMYQSKASDFMFKQFAGFKDFTMNTAKSGMSAGEKSAFWFVNKLRRLSKKWFTHLFLTLCLVLYSVIGACTFMAIEGPNEIKYDKDLSDIRREVAKRLQSLVQTNAPKIIYDREYDFFREIEDDLANYEANYTECMKHINNNDTKKKTWGFWNSMFYAGTIYTTIGKNTYPLCFSTIMLCIIMCMRVRASESMHRGDKETCVMKAIHIRFCMKVITLHA